jgi:putative transposase
MPKGLVRLQESGDSHFITFSCYGRRPYFDSSSPRECFEEELEQIRKRYEFTVSGYVVMPEHVHILVSEPVQGNLAGTLQVLKQMTARRLKSEGMKAFWQARYYDFNVFTEVKRIEKLRYIHRNPVHRGLVQRPEDWPWSSFRHYATGLAGTVEIQSKWTPTPEN